MADNVLVGHTVRAFPGVKHVINGFIYRIFGIDRRQTALSGGGVRLLRMSTFGNRNDPRLRSLINHRRSTAQSGTAGTNYQKIALDRRSDV